MKERVELSGGSFDIESVLPHISKKSRKVTIWYLYIHLGYMNSSSNPQTEMLSLSDDLGVEQTSHFFDPVLAKLSQNFRLTDFHKIDIFRSAIFL